jgi:membrane-associated HD superfamily phosphohydrolase
MAIRRDEKEDNAMEKAQKQAEMIGEFAKDARNRKEAQKIANKLDSAIEQNNEKKQNLESAAAGQQEYAVEEILEDTKDDIRSATKEVAREIPQYTQRLGDIQEQTIQTTREIAYNYIEAQKEIISIYQSVWTPFIKNASILFWNYWSISPKGMAETYGTVIRSFTENVIAGTRLTNSTISVNTKLLSTALQQTKDNSKELSRLSINAAKIFSETSNNLLASGNSR